MPPVSFTTTYGQPVQFKTKATKKNLKERRNLRRRIKAAKDKATSPATKYSRIGLPPIKSTFITGKPIKKAEALKRKALKNHIRSLQQELKATYAR